MPDRVITRRLLRDQVRDALREAIVSGKLQPGERLDDTEIQRWLGVSRTPVRQAIAELVTEGFVETAAQSYTRVVAPDPADVPFVLDAIGMLLSAASRRAVPRLDKVDREAAATAAAAVSDSCFEQDRVGIITQAQSLFKILERECGNPEIIRLCASVSHAYPYRLGVTMGQHPLPWGRFAELYLRLSAAIADGDGERAAKIVDELHAPTVPL